MRSLLLKTGPWALVALLLLIPALGAWAQPALGAEQSTSLSGSPSLRPIPASDQMWRKAIWRAIDLREKQNQPLFAAGHQLTQLIIDAVKRGELQAYQSDSLTRPLAVEQFRDRLLMPGQGPVLSPTEMAAGIDPNEDNWDRPVAPPPTPNKSKKGKEKPATTAAPVPRPQPPVVRNEYLPRQLYQLELKEEMIFDKRRSRMNHKIKALTIVIPAAETPKGFDMPVASFAYADLVRVFRAHPTEAIWFNPQNSAQHKNLADAFDLWLFSSYITKVENSADKSLAELYGEKAGLYASQEAAADLIEFEDNLWSH